MVVNLTHRQWLNMMRTHLIYIDGLLSCCLLLSIMVVVIVYFGVCRHIRKPNLLWDKYLENRFHLVFSFAWAISLKTDSMCIVIYLHPLIHIICISWISLNFLQKRTTDISYTVYIYEPMNVYHGDATSFSFLQKVQS